MKFRSKNQRQNLINPCSPGMAVVGVAAQIAAVLDCIGTLPTRRKAGHLPERAISDPNV